MMTLEYLFLWISLWIGIWTAVKVQERFFPLRTNRVVVTGCFFLCLLITNLLGKYWNHYLVFAIVWQVSFLFLFHILYEGKIWMKLSAAGLIVAVMNFAKDGLEAFLLIIKLLVLHKHSELFSLEISCIVYIGAAVILWESFERMSLYALIFSEKYAKFIGIPVCGLIFLTDLVNYGITRGVSMVSNANGEEYWDPYVNEILAHLECMVLAILSMVIILCLAIGMNKMIQYRGLEQMHRAEVTYYEELLEEHHRQSHLRHDMKNHGIVMSRLIEEKNYDELERYMKKIYREGHLGEQEIQTGNKVVDALVNRKKYTAKENQIPFECEMNLVKPIAVDDFDLCVLLGNLLDNAIHAENQVDRKEKRYVTVRAEMVKRNLILEVKNAHYKREQEEFDERRYGIGLMNVKNVVEKNKGVLDISICDTEFCVSVLLPVISSDRI